MLTLLDEQGRVLLDLSSRVVKVLGSIAVGGKGTAKSGFLDNPWFLSGRPFAMPIKGNGWFDPQGYEVRTTISGTRLTWSYPTDTAEAWQRPETTIVYGIY